VGLIQNERSSYSEGKVSSEWPSQKQKQIFSCQLHDKSNKPVPTLESIAARLAAERHIPVIAEALYNRRALVQKLVEQTGETEWDAATMPEQLEIEEGVDVEHLQKIKST
jgi:hypothetical protein